MRIRLDLRNALALHVLLPVVVAMSLAAVLAVRGLEHQMERRMQEDVELVARALQHPVARSLERGRSGAVQEALESAFRIDRVFGAYLYDVGGETLAIAGREEALPRSGRLSELAERGRRQGEYGEVAGRNVYSYFVPLTDSDGRAAALLQVTRRKEDFQAYFDRLRWQAGGLLTASWLAVGALVLAGNRRVAGRPLSRLLESMARIGRGDRTHRAEERGPREMVHLARRLNSMLDGITRAEVEIEQRREREAALREELRHSERLAALGRLAAGVAHELGTPLSVIAGRVERARRHAPQHRRLDSTLDEIVAQVRRMESVVRELLDFGRRGDLEIQTVQVANVCRAASAAVEEAAVESGVQVRLLPPPADLALELDAGRLERVLINLLRNGIHASAGGRLELGWEIRGSNLVLTIDDDGPGVPPELRAKIFDPYFTTKPVGEGSGLGLAMVHGMIQELGGSVRATQGPLGGARFEVELPGPPRRRAEGS